MRSEMVGDTDEEEGGAYLEVVAVVADDAAEDEGVQECAVEKGGVGHGRRGAGNTTSD